MRLSILVVVCNHVRNLCRQSRTSYIQNYKIPGHLNHMKFLFNDLHLKKNKEILEKLFDKEARTTNDVIIFYVKVIGEKEGVLQEKTYLRKIYGDQKFSAIQRTTALEYAVVWICILMEKLTQLVLLNKKQLIGRLYC